jgi:uncharacterized protein (TIGR02757 family)
VAAGRVSSPGRSRAHLRRFAALRPILDRLYADFNRAGHVPDPVEFLRRYDRPCDREVVAFLAAGLAFGRVASINQSIQRVLSQLGPRPAQMISSFDRHRDGWRFDGFVHRWVRGQDIAGVIDVLSHAVRAAGSVEAWFVQGWDPTSSDVGDALESFSRRALAHLERAAGPAGADRSGAAYFFPRPSGGSACKRLNLFLRWMVRRDALDPGGWTRVRPGQLIVPLDTHVVRVGQCLGLTSRAAPGWAMAREITDALRLIDADDPVKYDFAICHLGMLDLCAHQRPSGALECPLSGVCRPARRRRRASRGPSAPP